MVLKYLAVIILLATFVAQTLGCGYETCPVKHFDPSKLHLHIISHSHDDVGWLQTADGLFLPSITPPDSFETKSLIKKVK